MKHTFMNVLAICCILWWWCAICYVIWWVCDEAAIRKQDEQKQYAKERSLSNALKQIKLDSLHMLLQDDIDALETLEPRPGQVMRYLREMDSIGHDFDRIEVLRDSISQDTTLIH